MRATRRPSSSCSSTCSPQRRPLESRSYACIEEAALGWRVASAPCSIRKTSTSTIWSGFGTSSTARSARDSSHRRATSRPPSSASRITGPQSGAAPRPNLGRPCVTGSCARLSLPQKLRRRGSRPMCIGWACARHGSALLRSILCGSQGIRRCRRRRRLQRVRASSSASQSSSRAAGRARRRCWSVCVRTRALPRR